MDEKKKSTSEKDYSNSEKESNTEKDSNTEKEQNFEIKNVPSQKFHKDESTSKLENTNNNTTTKKANPQDIIAENFVLLDLIGKGAFGEIFLSYSIRDDIEIAVKREKKKSYKTSQLKIEAKIYQTLLNIQHGQDISGKKFIPQDSVVGVPKFYGVGSVLDMNYLIIEFLGPNLIDLFHFCKKKTFTISSVCLIGLQILNRIENLHKHYYIHRDIKPENFVIGIDDQSNVIYLIDFGLSKRYKNPKTHQHIPYREGRALTGTARYVSINTHLGIEQSRRDDLESIGYLLIFFLRGSLPWQGLRIGDDRYRRIMEKKLQIPTEILCFGLPDEIGIYLNYCKSLKFEDRPDYDYLRNLLIKLIGECATLYGINGDYLNFDWAFDDLDLVWKKYNSNQGNVSNRINNRHESEKNTNFNDSDKMSINKYNSLGEKSPLFQKINNKIKRELTEINETPDNDNNPNTHRKEVFDKTSENNPSIANSSSDIDSGSKKKDNNSDDKKSKNNSDNKDDKSYSSSDNTIEVEFNGIQNKTLIKENLSKEEYNEIFDYMNHDTIDNIISTIVTKGKNNKNVIKENDKNNNNNNNIINTINDIEEKKSASTQKLSSSNINIINNVPDKITVKEFEESKNNISNLHEEKQSELNNVNNGQKGNENNSSKSNSNNSQPKANTIISNTFRNSKIASSDEKKSLIENVKKNEKNIDSKISLDSKEEKKNNKEKQVENKTEKEKEKNKSPQTKRKKIVKAQTLNQLQQESRQKQVVYQKVETFEKKETKTESKANRKKSKILGLKEEFKLDKESLIPISKEPINKYYKILNNLGQGSFGQIKKVQNLKIGQERAMKIIDKEGSTSKNEISILRKISHPNIVNIYEIFEDSKKYYIMYELLKGGELFDAITSNGFFNEVDACFIFKQIMLALNYLHELSIVHRDLKPENIMLVDDKKYTLKIIDFGAGIELQPGKVLTTLIGTSYYIAPEVLKKNYTEKCDIWSCGIILYILLCGYPPFNGNSNKEIYKEILSKEPDFSAEEWLDVSPEAIDLIKNMLVKNPDKRFNCKEVLEHQWFKKFDKELHNRSKGRKNSKYHNLKMIEHMAEFVEQNKLKQAVLKYITTQFALEQEEEKLKHIFKEFDTDGNGMITKAEFSKHLIDFFGENDVNQITEKIYPQLDVDKSGEISYNEFLTALIDSQKIITVDKLEKAFNIFDRDNNGKLSVEEIKHVFGGNEEGWKKIIKEVDTNNDGEVDFEEFKTLMLGWNNNVAEHNSTIID